MKISLDWKMFPRKLAKSSDSVPNSRIDPVRLPPEERDQLAKNGGARTNFRSGIASQTASVKAQRRLPVSRVQ